MCCREETECEDTYEMSRRYNGKKAITIATMACLLAAALMGCAEDRPSEEIVAVQPEVVPEMAAGATSGTFQEILEDSQDSLDDSESGTEDNEPSPKPSVEPFVDKLTETGVGWGLSFGESGQQPVGNASPEELAQYDAYFLGDDSEKVIYLTFDCGYENGNTEAILDALKAHDAQGTFFVVGHYLESAPELVKRMVEEGHAVGNHTFHHYDIDTLDETAFQEELKAVEDKFLEVTGSELSPFYRPPEGKCGITNMQWAQAMGYNTIFWSLAHVDWDAEKQPTHEAALEKLTARIHPGAIVLLHNTSSTNGEILDELLTKWEEMGYTFAPLSSLTQ